MKLVADIHTHTLASGHAYGTVREMIHAASEKGLQMFGMAEHGPGIPGTVDPFYFTNLSVVPRVIEGVEIVHGCEINVLNDGTLSLDQKTLSKLDYGIVGIHKSCYEEAGIEGNTKNLISCMKDPKVFFVSHPDDGNIPIDYDKVVRAAKEYHVALELNNSSLVKKDHRLNCEKNLEIMLELCRDLNWPIIVNSDAHDPWWVGEFTLAIEFMERMRFPEDLVLNTDKEMLKEFIGLKL